MEKLQIICVDDQREVLAAVKKDLEIFEEYCELHTCETADEAEELFQELKEEQKPVALIICDHIMPGENGIDFFIRLNRDGQLNKTQKMLLTGLATHQETIKAINEANIDFYIEKPWVQVEFQNAVKKLLTRFILKNDLNKADFKPLLDEDELKKFEA
ncbi:response regulator [Caldithrix abyssi]|uniref:Response regulator receiver n=1 Tax=Caldithrix abyssi DSM 13497 TaxID=880073 RepID=H1XPI2_CALAY|nr:response regulator [Caldithrix abyssi]APF19464.1 two-component system, chemotaxis family, response regulator CheY [Caldithrix abyssi DSM 13497]EHO43353.1 response regulator receiver [Caldithrix abyssi DSM 13497]